MIAAHAGIEDGTGWGLLLAWSWDPLAWAGLVLLAVLYARGLARARPARLRVLAWWRPVLFYAGVGVLLLSLASPLDALAAHLFAAHMVQHMLLTMVGPPLLLLGAPVLPLMRGTPGAIRSRVLAPLARWRLLRRLAGLLTAPLAAWPLYVGTFWAWHLPGLYSAALESEAVHIFQHLAFLGTALLFWWNVVDPVPLRARLPYLGRFAYIIFALIQSTPLAAALTFSSTSWYRLYTQGPRLWGTDPLLDQQGGGLIMWMGGWTLYFIAFSVLFFVAANKDEAASQAEEASSSPSAAEVQR